MTAPDHLGSGPQPTRAGSGTAKGRCPFADPSSSGAAPAQTGGEPAGARNQAPTDYAARDRAALAAALDPIVTIDAKGIIQSASDTVERVLGWKPADLLGHNVKILMPEPHHSGHDGYLNNYHRTGKTNIMNRPRRFEALRKDGSLVPIELCVSRAEMPAGVAPLFVGIIRDMSLYAAAERGHDEERIRAQQQLAEQTSALQQANLRLRMADRMATIGTLAAGLGHDMNNVLLPVRARLNALKAAGGSGRLRARERSHVDEIRKSVAYLQQLADGLHFLAMDPDAEEDARGGGASTDLYAWWSQAGTIVSKAVPRHVRVTADFPAGLPVAAIAAHGLTQAILNLVVNAGEAIPPPSAAGARQGGVRQGSVRLWAEQRQDERGTWVWIGVTDNGTGMSDDVRRRAVEMFFTTKPRGLGTGLGLALVRNVADRTGGRVEIESEVGRGTTVALVVPAQRSAASSQDRPEATGAAVTIKDGRASALVRHVLEVSGAPVRADNDPKRADIWVLEPAAASLAAAKAWRARKPHGRLVLFGEPGSRSRASWGALEPITIEHVDDFEALRAALARAVQPTL